MSASRPNEPLRLSADDLCSPRVDAFLDEQAMLNRSMPEVEPRPWNLRVLYSSYFYLSLASGLGAFVAWMALRAVHQRRQPGRSTLVTFLLFPTVAGFVGLFLGAAEGIMCRNAPRAMLGAAVGLGVGFLGGLSSLIPAGIIFVIMMQIGVQFWKNPQPGEMPTGLALLIFMMGRAAAWALAAIPAGIGQGIALREPKVVLNGLLGGVLGGLLGGLCSTPSPWLITPTDGEAWLSRGIGLTVIGMMVGLFVGIVEQWTKTAWLLMRAGPLAGKQFVIYRNPTVLGSSPKAEFTCSRMRPSNPGTP